MSNDGSELNVKGKSRLGISDVGPVQSEAIVVTRRTVFSARYMAIKKISQKEKVVLAKDQALRDEVPRCQETNLQISKT